MGHFYILSQTFPSDDNDNENENDNDNDNDNRLDNNENGDIYDGNSSEGID